VITEPSENATRLGPLRLEIGGFWLLEEFQSVLSTIDDVYTRVATTTMLGDLVREEQRRNNVFRQEEHAEQMDWAWTSTYYGSPRVPFERELVFEREPLPRAIEAVRPFTSPLAIDALRLESPGWAQIIGNINPLKIIADFITKWRAENTKRMKIQSEERRSDATIAFERDRMHRAFALDVLRQMPSTDQHRAAERLSEIAEYAITPSINALERMVADARVGDAEIVDPRTPLPTARVRRGKTRN
jgi:hypothetical protein